MLLKAIFQNILSFDKETEISFIAGNAKSLPEQISRDDKRDNIPVLKTSLILGPNGSGKSNLCKCIECIQAIALGEFKNIYLKPFKLGKDTSSESKISVTIKSHKYFYEYTVCFNSTMILSESLYKVNARRRKLIFDRTLKKDTYTYDFGAIRGTEKSKQFIDFISEGTPNDNSFLHEYIHRNGKGISDIQNVFEWFLMTLKVIFPSSRFRSMPIALKEDDDFSRRLRSLMKYFNTGVDDIKNIKINFDEAKIRKEDRLQLAKDFKLNPKAMITIWSDEAIYLFEMKDNEIICSKEVTEHHNALDQPITFDINEESDGTVRLLDILPMMIDYQTNPAVYLIDEIDRSMHPLLTKGLLEYYFKLLSPDKDTQLICTTHEAYLLDEKKLRPDQFWFIRKNKGASDLSGFENPRIRKVLSKSYLNGDNGAIPFFDEQYLDSSLISKDKIVTEIFDEDFEL